MMGQLITLFAVECTKLTRSQALLMTLLCPLSIVGLQFLVVVNNGGKMVSEKGWESYWLGTISLWYMLMLPLYIALITSLINAIEHKHNGWRLMATMPIKQWQLFIVKALVAWLFVMLASMLMYVLTSASIVLMTLIGYQAEASFASPFLSHLSKVMIAVLPIIMIGHLISWRVKNIILPLAVGVIMTIVATTVVSSKYWLYDPWTYHLVATLVTQEGATTKALVLGGTFGAIILTIGAWLLGKREVHD